MLPFAISREGIAKYHRPEDAIFTLKPFALDLPQMRVRLFWGM
jgi:hypothetical protein